MAQIALQGGVADILTLKHGAWTAGIALRGAELMSLHHDRLGDLLWSGDPRWWGRRAPILFPVVGRSANDTVRIGGTGFPMPLHGFTKDVGFALTAAGNSTCRLELRDSAATRIHYPFAFRLTLDYSLSESGLTILASVHNTSDGTMPASFGFHPGFLRPFAGLASDDLAISFHDRTKLAVRRAEQGYMLSAVGTVALDDGWLAVSDHLFEAGSLVLGDCGAEGEVIYGRREGPALRLVWSNLPTLVIWSLPGAPFVCVEPWAGEPDPKGFGGELKDRPGIRIVPPGSCETFRMAVSLCA